MQWKATALCFFLRTEEGTVVFKTTLWLSPKKRAGPLMGTPEDLRLWTISMIRLMAILAATSSKP